MNELKENGGGIAAFFDLDGTLLAGPSLERRFFRFLRYQGAIPVKNYFLWLRRAARLARGGMQAIRNANKMHLRGVPIGSAEHWAEGISFFAAGVDRVAWHANKRHKVVIVSGTLEMLALKAAKQLEAQLEARELAAEIHVRATQLEESAGKWTGELVGAAMYRKAKADAVRSVAEEEGFDLTSCYAYGDSVMDRGMLTAVGHPVAVNASRELLRFAREKNWAVMAWEKHRTEESTEITKNAQRSGSKQEVVELETRA